MILARSSLSPFDFDLVQEYLSCMQLLKSSGTNKNPTIYTIAELI